MVIQVTQEHIDTAFALKNTIAKRSMSCPVALALIDHNIPHSGVSSSGFSGRIVYYFDPRVSNFIREFDEGIEVRPFEFKLDYVS